MFRLIVISLTLFLSLASNLQAQGLPSGHVVSGQSLTLNGKGERTKLFIKLYQAGLYLPAKSTDATGIITADSPMSIRLLIVSDLITAEKMEKATREGFDHATGGNIEAIANDVDRFVGVFKQGIKSGDVYDLEYTPDTGTVVKKNGITQESITGLSFKQALFGIWLGEKPAQEKLKTGLLGG